ncbi:hypothetical protein NIES2100_66280 [Calothrix sp. NIES-2100]|nr:hypothetical protein NIES2100_66280 [Calothrix sp. NIES-2100]
MKNSTHGSEFWAWGIGHGEESPMPNAQCPKRREEQPRQAARGWSFPSLT